mmetsp:Transcript_29815/g.58379  ORF Transcript_29815/g.58379 Transcript_29815/m.58379 type:complete len:288 (+) Transcript_29815:550-1413(+)
MKVLPFFFVKLHLCVFKLLDVVITDADSVDISPLEFGLLVLFVVKGIGRVVRPYNTRPPPHLFVRLKRQDLFQCWQRFVQSHVEALWWVDDEAAHALLFILEVHVADQHLLGARGTEGFQELRRRYRYLRYHRLAGVRASISFWALFLCHSSHGHPVRDHVSGIWKTRNSLRNVVRQMVGKGLHMAALARCLVANAACDEALSQFVHVHKHHTLAAWRWEEGAEGVCRYAFTVNLEAPILTKESSKLFMCVIILLAENSAVLRPHKLRRNASRCGIVNRFIVQCWRS